MNKLGHTFIRLAPLNNGDFWFWCIRCGTLKIGESYFKHGPKQTKLLKCCIKDPKCKTKKKNSASSNYDMPPGAWG